MSKKRTPEELREQALGYRQMARTLEQQAFERQQEQVDRLMRKRKDKLINRSEAIDLLWFGSYESLKNWEKKMGPFGYLKFEDSKILRSEVLRFRDDYYSGKIKKMTDSRKYFEDQEVNKAS
jgi:hypothetical protein